MKARDVAALEAQDKLRGILYEGATVYCYIKRVSSSGMSRVIVPLAINTCDERGHALPRPVIRNIGYLVAQALQLRDDGDQGVRVHGVGMNMIFYLVDHLSHKLYDKANALRYEHI